MNCPNCDYHPFNPSAPCPHCQFKAEAAAIEEWFHIRWLLTEMNTWDELGVYPTSREKIWQQYTNRLGRLESRLKLKPPALTPLEAGEVWVDIIDHEVWLEYLAHWSDQSWLTLEAAQTQIEAVQQQLNDWQWEVQEYDRPAYPRSSQDRLDLIEFLITECDLLQQTDVFTSSEAAAQAKLSLLEQKQALEEQLGLKNPELGIDLADLPKPADLIPSPDALASEDAQVPAIPLRERIWRSLLSEQTLQAILFLGIFLLFAAGLSFAILGWQNFSPTLRIAIPITASLIFFGAGRYIRLNTNLARSGLALSAIAALLVPIDFYTIYTNYITDPNSGPIFWLFASVTCLLVYSWATYLIGSRLFGYLVVTAAGSLVLALIQLGHQTVGLSIDWRSGGLSVLALGLMALGRFLSPPQRLVTAPSTLDEASSIGEASSVVETEIKADSPASTAIETEEDISPALLEEIEVETEDVKVESEGISHPVEAIIDTDEIAGDGVQPPAGSPCPHVSSDDFESLPAMTSTGQEVTWQRAFAIPFRVMALLAVGILMPLTFGWRYLDRPMFDALHDAMTVTWLSGSLLIGWGATLYRSRSLGLVAGISLPLSIYFAQAAFFDQMGVVSAWHAFGMALLVPIYWLIGHKLAAYPNDEVLQGHRRTAIFWSVILLLVAALWPLTDLSSSAASAGSHAILALSMLWIAHLRQQPRYLYGFSLFGLTSLTFTLNELGLSLDQLTPAWASLALVHILAALYQGRQKDEAAQADDSSPNFASPLVISGYLLAALALGPALLPYQGNLLAYGLGNWLGLTAWGAWLAHRQQLGFIRPALFHWLTVLPLPGWLYVVFTNLRPADGSLILALSVLAWGMVSLSYRLRSATEDGGYAWPWYLTGLSLSLVAPTLFSPFMPIDGPSGFYIPLSFMIAGLIYLSDAFSSQRRFMFLFGGLIYTFGQMAFISRFNLSPDAVGLSNVCLVILFIGGGLLVERRKLPDRDGHFFAYLYAVAHFITLFVLAFQIYNRPFLDLLDIREWPDADKLWGAGLQLLLGITYGFFAWGRYQTRWGHIAAWLGAAGAGFIALAYSQGSGSSTAKAAILATVFVLAERGLRWAWKHWQDVPSSRYRAMLRTAWGLYKSPLYVTGWTISAVTIALALVRNLWLLGAGDSQKFWAWVGLLLLMGLYSLAAYLYQQARWAWFAALLSIAPWTILTNLGWYISDQPSVPGYAVLWVILAACLFGLSLYIYRRAGQIYALPPFTVSQVLIPFSLLWGVADPPTSRLTFGLSIGLYIGASIIDHLRVRRGTEPLSALAQTKFLYPALGLLPVWAVYLLHWILPQARYEHYGLLFLSFGPLGLIVAQWLKGFGPTRDPVGVGYADTLDLKRAYSLPAYLTTYVSLIVGTMLVAHITPLLALVFLYNAVLFIILTRLHQNSLWLYPASLLLPISMLIALTERGLRIWERADTFVHVQGWWLIGLAAIYLLLAVLLRRVNLTAYSLAPLTIGLGLIALGLSPSSQDRIAAFWGYGSAATLYLLIAFWLRQPLLLTPACALFLIPYAVGLQLSSLAPQDYGLMLLPGAIVALNLGQWFDRRFGVWEDFPWDKPRDWLEATAERYLNWWGLPLYTLGLGLTTASPFLTDGNAERTALCFALTVPLYAWATYRFRSRFWLLVATLAVHGALLSWLIAIGYRPLSAGSAFWLRFTPVTWTTMLTAMLIAWRLKERPPLQSGFKVSLGPSGAWSWPLYVIAFLDIVLAQLASLVMTDSAALVTLNHALLLALVASVWGARPLSYISLALGVFSLHQWTLAHTYPATTLAISLASLSLGYGLLGYLITLFQRSLNKKYVLRDWVAVWEYSAQRSGLVLSGYTLFLTLALGLDIAGWTVRAMFGYPFREIVDLATVYMVINVFSFLGLLYLTAAIVQRNVRQGYAALGLLISAWMVYVFYIQSWTNLNYVQWYAVPVGLYLIAIAYLEAKRGYKILARWIDYAALLLMLGSLFWQILILGWLYFLFMIGEGLAAMWWGSAHRLRRYLYAGVAGVILGTVGQLVNATLSLVSNQWVVFGLIGLVLVIAAIIVERKLDDLRAWQGSLESWE